jgi:hypothetical protein
MRLVLALAIALAMIPAESFAQADPTCSVLPTGEVPTSDEDPLVPVYCLPDAPAHAPTRVSGANDWVDTFGGIDGYARLNDGDMDYRVFDGVAGIARSKHLLSGDHWIDDNKLQYTGGAMLRPNRTFRAENGKLVVEGDVSAGKQVYRGNAWPEFVISTAPEPDINPPDPPEQNYAYGRFRGFPTFGCRLQDGGTFTCAAFTGSDLGGTENTHDRAPCFSLDQDRLWELSFFQGCGNYFGGVHFGGDRFGGRDRYFRLCAPDQDYDACMDRVRVELTSTGMVWYVNGARFFEDSGWDTLHQLPPALLSQPVYVYYADWNFVDPTALSFRFHWERLTVNPHAPDGSFAPPSASDSWLVANGQVPPPPTSTPVPAPSTPTSTAILPTATPTSTVAPPTSTPTSVPLTATPTSTPVPPSATPTATVAPPTSTPTVKPTVMPTPAPCWPPRARRCR